MPLLRMPVHEFIDRCQQDTLADDLAKCHRQARLGRLEDAEIRSWHNSLPALAHVLDEAGLQHVEVLIEYQLALSSLRADMVLAGWLAPPYLPAVLRHRRAQAVDPRPRWLCRRDPAAIAGQRRERSAAGRNDVAEFRKHLGTCTWSPRALQGWGQVVGHVPSAWASRLLCSRVMP